MVPQVHPGIPCGASITLYTFQVPESTAFAQVLEEGLDIHCGTRYTGHTFQVPESTAFAQVLEEGLDIPSRTITLGYQLLRLDNLL